MGKERNRITEFPRICMAFPRELFPASELSSEETSVTGWKYTDAENDDDSIELKAVPKNVRVYEISGPMFFGAADKILDITLKEYTQCLILRMRAVTALDATAMNSLSMLYEKCERKGVKLVLSHVNEQPLEVMKKAGFYDKVGVEYFCPHIDEALQVASALCVR